MRLLIVLPQQPEATGNFVTARRLQDELQPLGLSVELCPILPDGTERLTATIESFRPDRLLLLHAWRCGRPWLNCPAATALPTVVLLTGTDINHDIDDPGKGPVIRAVLHKATAIVSQNPKTVKTLKQQAPPWINHLHYIPAGVRLGVTPYPLREKHGIANDAILFLHPAGIRPVKANLELLQLCDPLAQADPKFVIAFCGPALDPDYFDRFITALEQRDWAHYLGVIPSEAMPSALREADLILNHSLSEGLANALLEAQAVGRPILARNIPGNAAIITSHKVGWLYSSDSEFQHRAYQFLSTRSGTRRDLPPLGPVSTSETEAQAFLDLFNSISS